MREDASITSMMIKGSKASRESIISDSDVTLNAKKVNIFRIVCTSRRKERGQDLDKTWSSNSTKITQKILF